MVDLDRRGAEAPGLREHVLDARGVQLQPSGLAEAEGIGVEVAPGWRQLHRGDEGHAARVGDLLHGDVIDGGVVVGEEEHVEAGRQFGAGDVGRRRDAILLSEW